MKLRENFITHAVNEQRFLFRVDSGNTLLLLNDTAAFIVDCLKEDVTESEIVGRVLKEYGISKEVAEPAVSRILSQLLEYGALES